MRRPAEQFAELVERGITVLVAVCHGVIARQKRSSLWQSRFRWEFKLLCLERYDIPLGVQGDDHFLSEPIRRIVKSVQTAGREQHDEVRSLLDAGFESRVEGASGHFTYVDENAKPSLDQGRSHQLSKIGTACTAVADKNV